MSDQQDGRIVGAEGVVRWFDEVLGYGFIIGPDEQDIFAHYSDIVGEGRRILRKGAPVHYDAEKTEKGWKATRIERLAVPEVRRRSGSPRRKESGASRPR